MRNGKSWKEVFLFDKRVLAAPSGGAPSGVFGATREKAAAEFAKDVENRWKSIQIVGFKPKMTQNDISLPKSRSRSSTTETERPSRRKTVAREASVGSAHHAVAVGKVCRGNHYTTTMKQNATHPF